MTQEPIDLHTLPAEVVARIDAPRPGADLVITRDGDPIATINRTYGAMEFDAPPAEQSTTTTT